MKIFEIIWGKSCKITSYIFENVLLNPRFFAGASGKLNRGQRRRRADSTEGFLTTDHLVFVSKLYLYLCYHHICISIHHTVQKVFSSLISLYFCQSHICICLTIVIQLGLNLHNFSLGAEGEWRLGGADETRWFLQIKPV